MIDPKLPYDWRSLQDCAAAILREAGVVAKVEELVITARGSVRADIWAHDPKGTPPQTYLIECKHWRKRIPQTVVHAFRAVVGDSGANWGMILSVAGFQRGAIDAAAYSNVRLHTWSEFESLFEQRWFTNYFLPEVETACDPLVEYTEPINSRIQRKAAELSEEKRFALRRLRETHLSLGMLCALLCVERFRPSLDGPCAPASLVPWKLPLRSTLSWTPSAIRDLPASVLDAESYRALLESIAACASGAIREFDELFGGRA